MATMTTAPPNAEDEKHEFFWYEQEVLHYVVICMYISVRGSWKLSIIFSEFSSLISVKKSGNFNLNDFRRQLLQ